MRNHIAFSSYINSFTNGYTDQNNIIYYQCHVELLYNAPCLVLGLKGGTRHIYSLLMSHSFFSTIFSVASLHCLLLCSCRDFYILRQRLPMPEQQNGHFCLFGIFERIRQNNIAVLHDIDSKLCCFGLCSRL